MGAMFGLNISGAGSRWGIASIPARSLWSKFRFSPVALLSQIEGGVVLALYRPRSEKRTGVGSSCVGVFLRRWYLRFALWALVGGAGGEQKYVLRGDIRILRVTSEARAV